MVLEGILNPIFSPLLKIDPIWSITIISVGLTFISTLIYKLVTDQSKMKILKDDLKSAQKEMKEHKNDPTKMMDIQKRAMEKNFEYMKHSFKPMLITMIPILLIFGWLNLHLAYEPIRPGQQFMVNANFVPEYIGNATLSSEKLEFISNQTTVVENGIASWKLKGEAGSYLLEVKYDDKPFIKELLISDKREYESVLMNINDPNLKSVGINNDKVIVMNLFGWNMSWIWAYIIISIIASIIIRKVMKVY